MIPNNPQRARHVRLAQEKAERAIFRAFAFVILGCLSVAVVSAVVFVLVNPR